MDRRSVARIVFVGVFISSLTWAVASLSARYGGLISIYLSEGELFVLIFVATAILSWLVLCYTQIDTPVFVVLVLVLPLMTIIATSTLHGATEVHPALLVFAGILTVGFLTGVVIRMGNPVLVTRYPTIFEPIAHHKWRLLLAAGIVVAGFGTVQYVTAPSPTVTAVEPGYDRSSPTFDVELATEPAHYRVIVETPTGETFHGWIATPEFRDDRASTSVRIATPNVAPAAGTYRLSVETLFGKTVHQTELTFDRGPDVVVSEISIDDRGSTVTVELENTGDLPAPLWDHDLYVDGDEHRIMQDDPAPPLLPGETATIRGDLGRVPDAHGQIELVTLGPGSYELEFELRATNQQLATHTETVEVEDGNGE